MTASTPVPILSAGFGQCRFIVCDRPEPMCCGASTTAGTSWCLEHRRLVYIPARLGTAETRRAKGQPSARMNQSQHR